MRIDVVTLFPELVLHAARFGVMGRALERVREVVDAALQPLGVAVDELRDGQQHERRAGAHGASPGADGRAGRRTGGGAGPHRGSGSCPGLGSGLGAGPASVRARPISVLVAPVNVAVPARVHVVGPVHLPRGQRHDRAEREATGAAVDAPHTNRLGKE